ncbi:MAG: Zn-dependent hydrolase [Ethanoligenens sp.]
MIEKADKNRIQHWLEGIDRFNSTPGAGTTRVLFTEPELASRAYIKDEMLKLGLQVQEDAIGNIFGVLEGSDPALPAVWTGSHIDTVPHAGMFDGMAGIVSGMEALRLIRAAGVPHKRNLTVVVYTSEEPTRFGLSCLGSRAMAGVLTLEETKTLFDEQGQSLYDVLGALGYDHSRYDSVRRSPRDVYAALELHIEQNSMLYKRKVPLGIVKGICAPTIFNAQVKGIQSHAGGTSMKDRHDAFAAASDVTLALERLAQESEGEYVTATVGKVDVEPNAVNIIPGSVAFSIDIRSIDMESKEILIKRLKQEVQNIQEKRGVRIELELQNHDIPLRCDARIAELLRQSCREQNLPYLDLISGPYHDSLFVGRFAPVAMLFVPSKDGISHSKDEWTDFADIARGVDVLSDTLIKLANE